MTRRFVAGVIVALTAFACSSGDDSSSGVPSPNQTPTTTGGTCPCSVGNASIQYTISCGGAQCIPLDGGLAGYRCADDGAHRDDSVCADGG